MKAEEKAEELLEKLEKEIHERWFKNKWTFLWCSFRGKFGPIRTKVTFEKPEEDKIEAFIGICDNRIDRLKTSTTEIVITLGAVIAALAVFLIKNPESDSFSIWEKIFLISVTALILLILYYRAHACAWYAVKEGVLLMKKNK